MCVFVCVCVRVRVPACVCACLKARYMLPVSHTSAHLGMRTLLRN